MNHTETTVRVCDYQTGDVLKGAPSESLIAESKDAGDTGAVDAYRDDAGVWQYVPEWDRDRSSRALQVEVITVWVDY